MSGDVSSVHGIPVHLWNLGLAVQESIAKGTSLEHWRDMVRRWAAEKRGNVPLVPLPKGLTIVEQYAILAAIHDVCEEAGHGLKLIDPWSGDDAESRQQGMPYHVLQSQILPSLRGSERSFDLALDYAYDDEHPSGFGIQEWEAEQLTALLAGLAADTTAGQRDDGSNENASPPGEDSDAWVTAQNLWPDRFATRKKFAKFRDEHPEFKSFMFRNTSNKLLIHAGRWATYWAKQDAAKFERLERLEEGNIPSIADAPEADLTAAAERMAALRAKKQQGK